MSSNQANALFQQCGYRVVAISRLIRNNAKPSPDLLNPVAKEVHFLEQKICTNTYLFDTETRFPPNDRSSIMTAIGVGNAFLTNHRV